MKPGGGGKKGAQFERVICRTLSRWITGGRKLDCFWRSAMSGGAATVAKRKGIRLDSQAGDICSISAEGHRLTDTYYVECKHVGKLKLGEFVLGYGKLHRYVVKLLHEAERHDKTPLMIARQNGWPTLLLTNEDGARHLIPRNGLLMISRGIYVAKLEVVVKRPFPEGALDKRPLTGGPVVPGTRPSAA